MSKRDIILFDIGRKTTGFSEKNHSESSEPAAEDAAGAPAIEQAPRSAARWSGTPLETPILEYSYMRIILIWGWL